MPPKQSHMKKNFLGWTYTLYNIVDTFLDFQCKRNLRNKHMYRKRGLDNHFEYLQVLYLSICFVNI